METQTNKICKGNKPLKLAGLSLVLGGILSFMAGGYVAGVLGTGSFNPKEQIKISQERKEIKQGLMKIINLDNNEVEQNNKEEYVSFEERIRFYKMVRRDPREPSVYIDTFLDNLYAKKGIFGGIDYQKMRSDLEKIPQYKLRLILIPKQP